MKTYVNEIPESILNDDTFLFHGSSNLSEKQLDSGVTDNCTPIPIDLINQIISVYKDMCWWGTQAGHGNLIAYSVQDNNVDSKYFFLGETPKRCSLYASKDFAGGEYSRTVYYSLKNLEEYLVSKEMQDEHRNIMERDFEYCGKLYDVDFNKLQQSIDFFKPILLELERQRNNYQYGIIYCYKIEKEDYGNLTSRNGGMGIRVDKALPKERLKAKLIFEPPFSDYLGDSFLDNLRTERSLIWTKRLKK